MKVVLNPSWPVDTVVDCCCGPLFTTLMQANAQLMFFGDHVPLHLQASTSGQSQQNQQNPQDGSFDGMTKYEDGDNNSDNRIDGTVLF